jgi:Ca2+-binding RTX toxin-like protein
MFTQIDDFGKVESNQFVTPRESISSSPGHIYFLSNTALGTSWTDAQVQAIAAGGNLVTINDAAENQWLINTFGTAESFWIGLNDVNNEGVFEWVSGEPVTYTNWAAGEPNNIGDEDYGELNPSFAPGQWNDRAVFASEFGGRGIIEAIASTPGTANDDTFYVRGGDVAIAGGLGNDRINSAEGNDFLDGGEGYFDRIFGGNGNDTITDPDGVLGAHGGAGNDIINVTFAPGWDNDNNAKTSPRSDGKITGGFGDDNITVTMNHSRFFLNAKGDEPKSNQPQDGNDTFTLKGTYANSVIDLGGGNDLFNGGIGRDNVSGKNGNDTLNGFEGDDRLDGGDGNDELYGEDYYTNSNDYLLGGAGNDYLQDVGGSSNRLEGGNGDDELYSLGGQDVLIGGSGQDRLYSEGGNDSLYGGDGDDHLEDTRGRNFLDGGQGNDSLYGGYNNDNLTGQEGDDFLIGIKDPGYGDQIDTLTGGLGADRFVLGGFTAFYVSENDSSLSVDRDYASIADFKPNEGDIIQLSGAATDYVLDEAITTGGQWLGTGIYLQQPTQLELIGILGQVELSNVSFDNGFAFV